METTTPRPVRPARLRVQVTRTGERLHLQYRRWSWRCVFGGWLWLAVTGGVLSTGEAIDRGGPLFLGIALASWGAAGWFAFRLLRPALEREELTLTSRGVSFTRRFVFPVCRRSAALHEILGFVACPFDEGLRLGVLTGIEMRCLGEPIQFAFDLDARERAWLVSELNDHLARLRQGNTPGPVAQSHLPDDDLRSTEALVVTNLTSAVQSVPPPAGSRWQLSEQSGELIFEQRGPSWREGPVGGLLLVVIFWNAMLGAIIFYVVPEPSRPRFPRVAPETAILLVMGLAGVLMCGMLLLALLEPFHRTVWKIGSSRVEHEQTWFGIALFRNIHTRQVDRAELQQTAGFKSSGPPYYKSVLSAPDPESLRLLLVDSDNVEICSIEGLPEREARWMGEAILRRRSAAG